MPETKPQVDEAEGGVALVQLDRVRSVHRVIRYTPAEWLAIVEAARACHRNPLAFVRETSLAAAPGDGSVPEKASLIVELGRCGTALVKLAATARASGALPEAARFDAVLAELLAAVRRLDRPRKGPAAG